MMDCIRDGAGRTQFRMQSALGLNWTPWGDLVTLRPCLPTRNPIRVSSMRGSNSVIVPEDGCEVASRKASDLIVVDRRRDDAGTRERLHRWGDVRNDGRRRTRGGVSSDGRGSRTWRRPLQSRRAARSAAGGGIPRRHRRRCSHLPARQPAATCRDSWTDRRVRLRRQVRRSGCSPLGSTLRRQHRPDGAAPAGPATAPAVALPTRVMPAPPSEARCVRSNSIRARW